MFSVVAISGGIATMIGGYLLWCHLRRQAQNHVRENLNAVRAFYDERLNAMAAPLRYTALGESFSQAVAAKEINYLAPRLEAVRKGASLDTLYVTDAEGRVIHRSHRPGVSGDLAASDRLVGSVLGGGGIVTGALLVPIEALERESPSLARRARIRIVATAKAVPSDRTELDAGLMLCAAAPVHGGDGKLVGVLRAGILLNRNDELVDQVQATTFRGEQYKGKPLGTATVFQQDVRISTNVLRQDGSRAIGTRVSAEVHDRVLAQGRAWLGRAWVVNDWYLSAYGPIRDMDGRPIGMLYVGVLQRRFSDAAMRTMLTFSLVTVGGLLAAALVAWKLADRISRPIRSLADASEAIARGEALETVRLNSAARRGSGDEIDTLVRAFEAMVESLRERDELLKQRTRLQLTRSERLAAVGRLAAGVAHEINNPLTGILTFSHMLLRDAPDGSREQEDLKAIIDATTRCRDITRGLLNFSRQNEPQKSLSSLNGVLAEALSLTRNQAHLKQVAIVDQLSEDLPPLVMDPYQIQEVAVNVILNAIDATPPGGTLRVSTRPVEKDGAKAAQFEITDTGCGMGPKDLERIFDPFFTTKPPGKGTGLGLAMSYGIVTEHGGEITVASQVDQGTTVTVHLPVEAREQHDEDQGTDTGS